ncbi:MAG: hypothetical protein ACM3MD_11030 [Betaproteobacteria bacterium]
MLTSKGGQSVSKGTYWDLRKGHRVDIAHEGVLPGDETVTYFRMSSAVLLLLGPVIGLFYAILMPFIGIATVATLAGRKVLGALYNLVAKSISFGWQPKNAYLSGKKKKKEEKK